MKRVLAVIVAVVLVLSGLIAYRIHEQNAAERGPARGSGVIEAASVDLASRVGARVVRVPVAEGAQVEAGELLLVLDCAEPKARLAEAQARLAMIGAQAEAATFQKKAADGQAAAAKASVQAANAELFALAERRGLAERDAARWAQLGEFATVAVRDQTGATAASLEQQQRAALAGKRASMRQASAAEQQAMAAQAQAQAVARNVDAMAEVVRQAQILVDECTVRAPQAGVLERVYYDPGELVPMGSTVARILNPERMTATFYVSTADLGKAVLGMEVSVEADSYPEQTFRATVQRIGLEAEFTPKNIQTRSDRDRLVYPVEVRIADPNRALRTGMMATVILQER